MKWSHWSVNIWEAYACSPAEEQALRAKVPPYCEIKVKVSPLIGDYPDGHGRELTAIRRTSKIVED